MNAFEIVRLNVSSVAPTMGELRIEDVHFCWTLEDPWVDNRPNISCIPTGIYRVVMALSTRYQRQMPRLLDVPGRAGILIHPGNTHKDTEGCILVGDERTADTILKSRPAFGHFLAWFQSVGNEATVTIRNASVPAPAEVAA
jgi:hypothetical protein